MRLRSNVVPFRIATDMLGLFAYLMVLGGLPFEPWEGR